MQANQYKHWAVALENKDRRPAYLMIADMIAADIDKGTLQARDKLPPLRELASLLNLDYTTVARAYKEARGRGLIDSHPGTGSFIKGRTNAFSLRGGSNIEMTMNLPPEPRTPSLLDKIGLGFSSLVDNRDIYTLFRYQDFGGTEADKQAGLKLLSPFISRANAEQILVCPGIHSALVALLSLLVTEGSGVCVQSLVYPGLKAIAAQLDIKLYSIDSDSDGPIIRFMEDLCKTENISVIYLNPTLQNPTTHTFSRARRESIADLALRYSIPIIEDDAYAVLPENPVSPIANLAPELTYYITGLAKYFGAGVRTAYLYVPSKLHAQRTAGALRALSVMSSPITNALATRWIMDGSLDQMALEIRTESRGRQALAQKHLKKHKYFAHPDGFHLWIQLPKSIELNPSVVAAHLRSQNVSVVSSAAFCTDNNPVPALRMCLGGSLSRWECEESLLLVADILEHPSHLTGVVCKPKQSN